MKFSLIILCLFNLIPPNLSTTAVANLLTGTDCGKAYRVSGGEVASFKPIDQAPPIANNFTCYFTMRAVKNSEKVRLVFQYFELEPTDCAMANVQVFDGKTSTYPLLSRLCPGDNIIGTEYLSTSYYLTIKLTIAYSGIGFPLANFSGYWVSFTDDKSPCSDPSLQMQCGNGRCIYQELECDNLDSCGDGTDESSDPPLSCGKTSDAVDLTILYVTLAMAFAMFCVYLMYALLSVTCFKSLAVRCLVRCCVMFIRRRRHLREAKYKSKVNPEDKKHKLPQDQIIVEDIDK